MSGASALWSRQQREWLQALGHAPLTLVDPRAAASADPARTEPQPTAEPAKPAPVAPIAPIAPDEPNAREARPPVPAPQPAAGLQRALLRATGLPAAEASRVLESLGVDAAALQGDPAAKRLLWSRLRRLRAGRSP